MSNTGDVKEYIKSTSRGDFICVCGNTPSESGFYPINDQNEEVQPVGEGWTTNQYYCNRCGRVIDQDTLEVVRTVDVKNIKQLH